MALLLPFGLPPHHSTPDHNYAFEESSGTSVDADGIKHSFDKSLNTSAVPTETAICFLGDPGTVADLPDVNPRPDSRASITPMDELADPNVTQNVDVTAIDTPSERTPFSSFSNFIYQPPQDNNPDVAAFSALVASTSAIPPQFSGNEFVTSSDLAALERRMQVLVSEVTTAVSSRLFEQFSMTPTVTTGATTLAETSGINLDSSLVFSPTSVSEDQPTPPPGRSRRERSQLRARDRVPPHDPQGDQASASNRPRPRLQLTGSMYKKHPVFKFFVTAPAVSENHPHKWRCRVCPH